MTRKALKETKISSESARKNAREKKLNSTPEKIMLHSRRSMTRRKRNAKRGVRKRKPSEMIKTNYPMTTNRKNNVVSENNDEMNPLTTKKKSRDIKVRQELK